MTKESIYRELVCEVVRSQSDSLQGLLNVYNGVQNEGTINSPALYNLYSASDLMCLLQDHDAKEIARALRNFEPDTQNFAIVDDDLEPQTLTETVQHLFLEYATEILEYCDEHGIEDF